MPFSTTRSLPNCSALENAATTANPVAEFGVQATGRSGMSSKFAVDDYPFLVVLAIIPIFAVFGFLFIFLAGFGRNCHPFVVGVVLPLEFCLCLLSSTRRFLFLLLRLGFLRLFINGCQRLLLCLLHRGKDGSNLLWVEVHRSEVLGVVISISLLRRSTSRSSSSSTHHSIVLLYTILIHYKAQRKRVNMQCFLGKDVDYM